MDGKTFFIPNRDKEATQTLTKIRNKYVEGRYGEHEQLPNESETRHA